MFTNPLKMRLQQGLPAVGHWISMPSASVAEILATHGPDWLLVDTEHGPITWDTLEDILRALKGTDIPPLARVRANDASIIKQVLDRGVYGVLVPLVNTAEEARAAVAACKYPPEGMRGVAGTRVTGYGRTLPDYFERWNSQVVVGVQIETTEALANVEKIAAVPGVDILFIGPNDLSASLGLFRQYDHPEFTRAVDRILKAAQAHRVAAGYMCFGPEEVLQKIDQGFRFLAAGSDARLLSGAMAATYQKIREGIEARLKTARA
ncbi:MAG: aldolase/citrate lyase family protein [Armatimonadota bacterium]|nr:aldolase/citrate lyase family protein [Armatimonadota bacterium]